MRKEYVLRPGGNYITPIPAHIVYYFHGFSEKEENLIQIGQGKAIYLKESTLTQLWASSVALACYLCRTCKESGFEPVLTPTIWFGLALVSPGVKTFALPV